MLPNKPTIRLKLKCGCIIAITKRPKIKKDLRKFVHLCLKHSDNKVLNV